MAEVTITKTITRRINVDHLSAEYQAKLKAECGKRTGSFLDYIFVGQWRHIVDDDVTLEGTYRE